MRSPQSVESSWRSSQCFCTVTGRPCPVRSSTPARFITALASAAFWSVGAWSAWLGSQTPLTAGTAVFCALIIGGGEGIGMLTMYIWHNLRERHADTAVTTADPRTQGPHHDPDA